MRITKNLNSSILFLSLFAVVLTFSGCGQKKESSQTDEPAIDKPALEKDEGVGSYSGDELEFQTTCPVMKNPINKELYVDHNGKRIYVCCKACIDKVKNNPEKYIGKLEEMGQKPHPVN